MKLNTLRLKSLAYLIGFCSLILPLWGCKQGLPPNYVMSEWSGTIRQLGVVPIFPPREDIQVGDIYLYSFDPESKQATTNLTSVNSNVGTAPRWSSVPVTAALTAEYKNRPSLPATPSSYANILDSTTTQQWSVPTGAGSSIFSTAGDTNRAREVSFPEFTAVSVSKGNLSALIPPIAQFGISTSSEKSVILKIPSAESVSINADVLVSSLVDQVQPSAVGNPSEKSQLTLALKRHYADKFTPSMLEQTWPKIKSSAFGSAGLIGASDSDVVYLRILSEVYYARALDITVQTNKSSGLNATASVAPTGLSAATILNAQLNASGAGNVPGGSIQFTNVSSSTISMRRIWQYPVAVGFRGVVLEVDKSTGLIFQAQAAQSEVPTLKHP